MTNPIHRALLCPMLSLAPTAALAGPATLAAVAAASLGISTAAEAQFARPLPTPVSAKDFEAMLRDAGLPESVGDTALPLHEAYFARFREFESREVDPALERAGSSPFDLARTPDAAREELERRRRFFARAAQLDGQLVDEVAGLLVAEDAVRLEKVRSALARRRAASVAPAAGFGGRAETFDLRRTAAFSALDASTRATVAPTLDAYDAELTRLLERYAAAALERPVRAAELREERGISREGPAMDGDGENPKQEAVDAWFRQMRELQLEAGKDVAAASRRIRRLHRDVLGQLEAVLKPAELRALRVQLASGVYPMLLRKDAFSAAVAEAEALRAKGRLDDAQRSAATAIIESHALAERPLLDALMDVADAMMDLDGAQIGGFAIEVAVNGEDASASSEAGRSAALRADLEALCERDATALRAAIGAEGPSTQVAGRGGRPDGIAAAIADGGAVVGDVTIGAVMMGGDGEMMVLSGDDMVDGGFVFGGALGGFGGGPGVPRPMTGDELDALAKRLGFGADDRPIFDEIVARAAEARAAAEAEQPGTDVGGAIGEGGATFTITFGNEGGGDVVAGGRGDPSKLAAAIEAAEERMFDELKAAVDAARDSSLDASLEAARRARARTRLLVGEQGAHAADLVAIAERAELGDSAQRAIGDELRLWDEGSVASIRAMRDELRAIGDRRRELFAKMTEETVGPGPDGGETVQRAVQIDQASAEEMMSLDRRGEAARTKVADAARRALDAAVLRLEGDAAAQKAIRRAYLRAVHPSTYRMPRDLSGIFTKALAIEGLGAPARADVERLRAEWLESREVLCEEFIAAREAEEANAKAKAGDTPMIGDVTALQSSMRERKRLRADLEQLESTIFRRLQDALLVEVGAEKARSIGELPTARRPAFQIGG